MAAPLYNGRLTAFRLRQASASAGEVRVEADLMIPYGVAAGFTGACPEELLLFAEAAAGVVPLQSGEVDRETIFFAAATFYSADPRAIERSLDAAFESAARIVAIGPSLALVGPAVKASAAERIAHATRQERLVLLASQDLEFLERCCDEIAVIDGGRIVERGGPAETLQRYRQQRTEALRAAAPPAQPVEGFARRGDGRAELVSLQLLGANGEPAARLASGERAAAVIRLKFHERVEDPVVGILIRSRIGVAVYGTNSEIENLHFGPCEAGEEVEVRYAFDCLLGPHEYTLTAASHDPDGVAHDWWEEAVLFTVTAAKPAAGVANLQARLDVARIPPGGGAGL